MAKARSGSTRKAVPPRARHVASPPDIPVNPVVTEDFARAICTEFTNTRRSIIEIGRILIEAKTQVPDGEWSRMFREKLIPLNHKSAMQFMAIARNVVLSDPAHVQLLPPAWGTLIALSRVPDDVLKGALRDGVITPTMRRREVRLLLPPHPAGPPAHPQQAPRRADPQPEAARPEPTASTVAPGGMVLAMRAIEVLAQISDDDPERQRAFASVRSWLNTRDRELLVGLVSSLGRPPASVTDGDLTAEEMLDDGRRPSIVEGAAESARR